MDSPVSPPRPGGVSVAGLRQAQRQKRRFDAVISVQDPDAPHWGRLVSYGPAPDAHLVLEFEDSDDGTLGIATITRDQLAQALDFARAHAAGSLLVHCVHGVGRSAALALAILADRMGPGAESDAVTALLAVRPEATPNLVAVALADDMLGRDGTLAAALDASESRDPLKLDARAKRLALARDRTHLFRMA